jgi:predicted RNase H-like HicB family nuclease
MPRALELTAIIEREDEQYVSLCPELNIASCGSTVEEARANLIEALEGFFEVAPPSEVRRRWHEITDPGELQQRLHNEVFITRLEITVG